MDNVLTVARPYAKAIFAIAAKAKDFSSWSDVLENLAFIVKDPSVVAIIKNPLISREDKAGFVKSVCKTKLSEKAQNFISLLSKNDRLDIIEGIKDLFESYKDSTLNKIKVTVSSAIKLNKEQQGSYIKELQGYFSDKTIDATFKTDKSLLGGVLVQAQDTIIDFSLKGKLEMLENTLAI